MQSYREVATRLASWLGAFPHHRSIFTAVALLAPAGALAQTTGPYTVTTAPEVYQRLPLNGGSFTATTIDSDEEMGVVNLPFPVTFFGQTYNTIALSTNRFASFTNDGNDHQNTAIPNRGVPNGIIAPFWDDGVCDTPIRHQTIGTAPNRQFIVEWICRTFGFAGLGDFEAQLWLTENSTTLQVKYGARGGGVSSGGVGGASIGIEDPTGTVGYSPPGCGASGRCELSDWPQNTVITYAQGPDVTVTDVAGSPVAYAGVTSHFEAVAKNVGGADANGFGMRFWVSTDRTLGAGDIEIGTSPGTADLTPGQTSIFALDAPIPTGLVPGPYFLLAEVDPLDVVRESTETNNVGVYGPFDIGLPAPDLVVESFAGPALATPGEAFTLEWTVRNIGNLVGRDVPYALYLSTNDVVTTSDRRIFDGVVSVEALTSMDVTERVVFPADVRARKYWLGISIDPEQEVFELDDTNNEGTAENAVQVEIDAVQIDAAPLPTAEIGAPYCIALQAQGGDGLYTWTVTGGALPPGLELREERAGLPDDEPPHATTICGTPRSVGTFDFTLRVVSGAFSATRDYQIEVQETGMPLTVDARVLAQARFHESYEEQLAAVGGRTPYAWSLVGGELPPGLALDRAGVLRGTPGADGPFTFTAEVVDAAGTAARAEFDLHVTSPLRLDCVSATLPASRVGETFEAQLVAAGGRKPYAWRSEGSRRLANGVTDDGDSYEAAPPGFRIDENGRVTATPKVAGRYAWEIAVTDAGNASDTCMLYFDVTYAQGLSVITSALPTAVADTPYQAQLQASGATGEAVWSLADGSFLPDGLELSASGRIAGTVPAVALEGAKTRTFSFLVRVVDEANRPAVAPLSIEVRAEARPAPSAPIEKPKEDGGCSAGAGVPGVLGIGFALALLRRRR